MVNPNSEVANAHAIGHFHVIDCHFALDFPLAHAHHLVKTRPKHIPGVDSDDLAELVLQICHIYIWIFGNPSVLEDLYFELIIKKFGQFEYFGKG